MNNQTHWKIILKTTTKKKNQTTIWKKMKQKIVYWQFQRKPIEKHLFFGEKNLSKKWNKTVEKSIEKLAKRENFWERKI